MDSHSKHNKRDELNILIATDIHLGYEYNKKSGHESDDSFVTFEEILQFGQDHNVDMVLLGGDLFHDAKPSQPAILRCMNLLRKYCLGPKEIKIELLSDPEVVFGHCAYKTVNYEDPNLNICMPVFSIHGNHDDPSFGAVGSMDVLSVSGLINYFGKWTDLKQITVTPLIIKKGNTHVAIYGLSYINDQRLSRMMRDHKIQMLRSDEVPQTFNICVLHQNRAKHSEYGYIPEDKLPPFLNYIVWGHEHECRIDPEFNAEGKYFISQPGSSIATSLCEGEAKTKHVSILSVCHSKFKTMKLRLKTVRPFVFDNMILEEEDIQKNYTQSVSESVYKHVDDYIENTLIVAASKQLTGHPKQPIQPLIRLRIFYTSEDQLFDTVKLAQKYCDEVANPMDMIVFRKQTLHPGKGLRTSTNFDDEMERMEQILACDNDGEEDWSRTVQGGITKYFSSADHKNKLTVLTVDGLNEALNRFVNCGDMDAFKDLVNHQMKKTISHLQTCEVDDDESIRQEIENYKVIRMERHEAQEKEKEDETMDTEITEVECQGVTKETEKKDVKGKDTVKKGTSHSKRASGEASEEDTSASTSIGKSSKTKHAKQQPKAKGTKMLQNYLTSSKKPLCYIVDDSD